MEPHPGAARPVCSRRTPATRGAGARLPRPTRLLAGLLAAVLVPAFLAGCGVRLQTPPPAEPVPDALEQVRRTAVDDVLLVAQSAEAALAGAGLTPEVTAELTRVAADSRAQAAALGGVYDSGLPDEDEVEPGASPSGAPAPAASVPLPAPGDVVVVLVDASARNRTAAGTTSQGTLARLLAAVGAAQTVSATRLAGLTGGTAPLAVTPVVPVPADDAASVDPRGAASGTGTAGAADVDGTDADGAGADGAGTTSPAPSPSPSPGGVATTAPDDGSSVPPEGLTADDLRAVVASEDAAGYALELRAALAEGDARARLLDRSRTHRERAQAWAELARTDGTDQDPRRVAYAVPSPAEADDAALVRRLESGLAADYATLVGVAAPGSRGVLVDLLYEGALTLQAWGAEPTPFPGLPEQQPAA